MEEKILKILSNKSLTVEEISEKIFNSKEKKYLRETRKILYKLQEKGVVTVKQYIKNGRYIYYWEKIKD